MGLRRSARVPRLPVGAVVGLLAASVLSCTSAASAQAPSRTLSILLTNEDGFDAPGITVLREVLSGAGHSVTVVAPVDGRGGSGLSATTFGLIDYYEQSTGVWAVDGTPADAVSLALVHLMRDAPPDIVVSGADFGQNVGAGVLSSGTVGAALAATRSGVPGIALSVAIASDGAEATPPNAATHDALLPAAAFALDLLGRLLESDAEGLLPPWTVLNVNYPAIGSSVPEGVRFAPLASIRPFRLVYSVAGASGPARVELAVADASRAEPESDYDLLSRGFVTISILDLDLEASGELRAGLVRRLGIER